MTFPENSILNLWVKATESKREAWHVHSFSVPNGQLHFATFAELQSPGFNVTAKYTGAYRNKHL